MIYIDENKVEKSRNFNSMMLFKAILLISR